MSASCLMSSWVASPCALWLQLCSLRIGLTAHSSADLLCAQEALNQEAEAKKASAKEDPFAPPRLAPRHAVRWHGRRWPGSCCQVFAQSYDAQPPGVAATLPCHLGPGSMPVAPSPAGEGQRLALAHLHCRPSLQWRLARTGAYCSAMRASGSSRWMRVRTGACTRSAIDGDSGVGLLACPDFGAQACRVLLCRRSAVVLDVQVGRYLDSSLIQADVQPKYVRLLIKGRLLQLMLPLEVRRCNGTGAQRSRCTANAHAR